MTISECASSEPYSTQIGPFGDKIRASTYVEHGSPVLRGTNVNADCRFFDGDFAFIDDAIGCLLDDDRIDPFQVPKIIQSAS